MAAFYINARCRQILNILLNQRNHMSMEQLAKEVGVSKRSVYYDVCKINVWLGQAGLPPLETERGRGFLLPLEGRRQIEALLSERSTEEIYIFSPEERVKLVILYVIHSRSRCISNS